MSSTESLYVVGIGASAGGLEALTTFFDNIPSDSGLAYIIVQHLSPDYKNFMPEILSKHTRMRIFSAETNMLVEPNRIYLMPPRKIIEIKNGYIALTDWDLTSKHNKSIDHFFESLAMDRKDKAIGIIMSGTGSDGSRGIEKIKKHGGMVMVQSEDTAKFEAMPKSAMLTGNIDYVLPPEQMGTALVECITFEKESSELDSPNGTDRNDRALSKILQMLEQDAGVDFQQYKQTNVLRRIQRRMSVHNIRSIDKYTEFLHDHPTEVSLLHHDLLIGVTQFFRDPTVFDYLLRKIVPKIVTAEKRSVRVWVTGCSTGEEAYSLAILFNHYLEQSNQTIDVKIFATDVNQKAVVQASSGVYTDRIKDAVSQYWLKRYFIQDHDVYRVKKEIRRMVIFAQHNLLNDPPFMDLDLVLCRNILIYLKPEAQHRVLSLFHFALHPSGYLLLGASESLGRMSSNFRTISGEWNVFGKSELGDSKVIWPTGPSTSVFNRNKEKSNKFRLFGNLSMLDTILPKLVQEYLPPLVVLNEDDNVLFFSGNLERFLEFPQGNPSDNIFNLIKKDLSVALHAALYRVRKDKLQTEYTSLKLDGAETNVNLEVIPLTVERSFVPLVAVFFRETTDVSSHSIDENHIATTVSSDNKTSELELQLSQAQEYLQLTREALGTSNEELQATNEELIASNEEMQSTNEELQSLNEELITVNEEHKEKIQELTMLNDDMDNLLISTNIATLFLDPEMCVRRFTPSIRTEIPLLEIDIGRPIAHISHKLKYSRMLSDVETVLSTGETIENEIESETGKWYKMRVMPYHSFGNVVNGVVITLIDITDLKMLNSELQIMSYVIEQSPTLVVISDHLGKVVYANLVFFKTRRDTQNILGKHILNLFNFQSEEESRLAWEQVQSGERWTSEVHTYSDGKNKIELATLMPIRNQEGHIINYLRISEDVTASRETEELLRRSEMLSAVGQLAAGIAHEIRNPLTALKGFTKLMSNQVEKTQYTHIMESELERIESIVSEMLVLAKPQVLDYETTNISDLIEHVIVLLESESNAKSIKLEKVMELDSDTIECVPGQIQQVLFNILRNAIHAVSIGGQVSITARTEYKRYCISVRDDGVGMSSEQLSQLGKPFFTTKEDGTGLGLMMSMRIVENHGGNIEINSGIGMGTEVKIYLPRKNDHF